MMAYENIKRELKIVRSIMENPIHKGKTIAQMVSEITDKYSTKELLEYVTKEIYKGNEHIFRDKVTADVLNYKVSENMAGNPVTETEQKIQKEIAGITETEGISWTAEVQNIFDKYSIEEIYDYAISVLYSGSEITIRDIFEKDIFNDEIFRSRIRTNILYSDYKQYYTDDTYHVMTLDEIQKNDSTGNDYYAIDDNGKLYEARYRPDSKIMFYTIPSGTNIVGYVVRDEIDTIKEQEIFITDPQYELMQAKETEPARAAEPASLEYNDESAKSKVKLTQTRQQLVDIFLNAIKSEEPMKWKKGWVSMDSPKNALSGKPYKGVNRMLLAFWAMMKGYSDSRWCTFKQANENGWKIKKGEKGTPIEFWTYYDKKTKQNITSEQYNNLIKENPDYKDNIRLVAREYFVFNAAQISGIPEPEKVESKITRIDEVEEFVNQAKAEMNIEIIYGGDRACYIPRLDEIHMPPAESFYSEYEFYATQLHEMAHATGASSRLNRDLSGSFGTESYAKEELRAEISSCFLSNDLGISETGEEHNRNHAAYIQSWIKVIENNPNELMRAVKDAENITAYLEEKGGFSKIQEKRMERQKDGLEKKQDLSKLNNLTKHQMLGKGR